MIVTHASSCRNEASGALSKNFSHSMTQLNVLPHPVFRSYPPITQKAPEILPPLIFN